MATKVLAILSLWRNSSEYIERALNQLEEAEKLLQTRNISCVYSFFENDSTDETPVILLNWLKDRMGLLLSERINAPKWGSIASLDRVRYQARYRNMALEPLNSYYNYDYLLIADSDVYWEADLISKMIDRLDDHPTWGMVSPNTVQNVRDYIGDTEEPSYFDSWSLKDLNNQQCLTFAANPFLTIEDRDLWDKKLPVSCNSAFGSIAMTKAEAMDDVEWDVIDGVEHWEFCRGIRDNGYEVIADPTLHASIHHKKEVIPAPEIVQYHQERLKTQMMASFLMDKS